MHYPHLKFRSRLLSFKGVFLVMAIVLSCAAIGYAVQTDQKKPAEKPEEKKVEEKKAEEKKPDPKGVRKLPPLTTQVVVLSINGLSSDHILRPQLYRHRIPHLIALRDRGSYAAGVEGVFPSQTLPAHATMVTGMLPVDHGVFADQAFSVETGATSDYTGVKQVSVDSLWEAVRRGSLKSAAVNFPLPEGAGINSEIGIEAVTETLKEQRANLIFITFRSFAEAAARHGLTSKEAIAALESIDAEIGKIAEAPSASQTTFVLVSDSARAPVEREFRPNVVLARKGLLTLDANGNPKDWRAICHVTGGSAAVFVKNPLDEKLIAEVEKAFREVHEKVESPIWRILLKREASRLGADPRAVLFLDAAPLFTMSAKASGGLTAGSDKRADSGYLPQRSEMRAALVIAGHAIKPGVRLEIARLVDVAPTICRLLGLELRTSRGRVLTEVLISEER